MRLAYIPQGFGLLIDSPFRQHSLAGREGSGLNSYHTAVNTGRKTCCAGSDLYLCGVTRFILDRLALNTSPDIRILEDNASVFAG